MDTDGSCWVNGGWQQRESRDSTDTAELRQRTIEAIAGASLGNRLLASVPGATMQSTESARRAQLLERAALVLNRSWLPVHVTSVRRALCMVVRDIARVVAADTLAVYSFGEWVRLLEPPTRFFVRSPSVRIPIPEVVLLRGYDRIPCHEAPFTRRNLFLRDDFTCQYCGRRCACDRLSIDHVTPRSRGGSTSWENCVLACVTCNARKADRPLKESGLHLLRTPTRPRWTPYLNLRPSQRLESWQRFAPDNRRPVA